MNESICMWCSCRIEEFVSNRLLHWKAFQLRSFNWQSIFLWWHNFSLWSTLIGKGHSIGWTLWIKFISQFLSSLMQQLKTWVFKNNFMMIRRLDLWFFLRKINYLKQECVTFLGMIASIVLRWTGTPPMHNPNKSCAKFRNKSFPTFFDSISEAGQMSAVENKLLF